MIKPFKFLTKPPLGEQLSYISEEVQEAYRNRSINMDLYRFVEVTGPGQQPIKMAVINAVNICHRQDWHYENYEHYFDVEGREMKLRILDIRSYRNPVYSFFKIRYKMCLANLSLDRFDGENIVINQLRLNDEEYNTLILQRPNRENI
jgi:hypothetical protein